MKYALTTLALAGMLVGCSHSLSHEIEVSIKLEDKCLLMFPACDRDGYTCVDSHGTELPQCQVACVAARTLMCEAEGPACTQRIGDSTTSDIYVSVLCVAKDLL